MPRRARGPGVTASLPDDAVQAGVVGRPHGVRGELRVIAESGDAERLVGLERAWTIRPGEAPVERRVAAARVHGDAALFRFADVATREEAASLTHAELWVRRDDLPGRGPGEFGIEDVLGATLLDGDVAVGRIVDLESVSDRDYLVVEVDGRRAMVPAVKEWLIELDALGRRVVMRLPEGLIEEQRLPGAAPAPGASPEAAARKRR